MEDDWSRAIRESNFSWVEDDVTIVSLPEIASPEPEEILRDSDNKDMDVFEVVLSDQDLDQDLEILIPDNVDLCYIDHIAEDVPDAVDVVEIEAEQEEHSTFLDNGPGGSRPSMLDLTLSPIATCSNQMGITPNQVTTCEFTNGSPGSTPFPSMFDTNKFDFEMSVPPTTPDGDDLEAVLKTEAARQERQLQNQFEMKTLLENYLSPHLSQKSRPRTKKTQAKLFSDELNGEELVAEIESKLRSLQVQEFSTKNGSAGKEFRRRHRTNVALECLRLIVPTLRDDSSESDVHVETSKYVSFLRSKASQKDLEEFVKENFF